MIGAEWVFSRSPELVSGLQAPGPALQVGASPWSSPHTWRYEIRNVAEAVVGEGECHLIPAEETMELTCTSTVQAYEVKQGQSTFASSGGRRVDTLRWQAAGGQFLSGSSVLDLQGGFGSQVDFRPGQDSIEIRYQEKGQPEQRLDLPLRKTALSTDPTLPLAADYTWPWQLAGLSQAEGEPGSVIRFNPYTWNNAIRASGPLAEMHRIKVTAPGEVHTPAGTFQAWPAANGDHDTAWYADIDGTRTVVKYFNGVETWALKP
jgi:hypothetical protein